jgi:UrcA family protein
MRPAAVPNRPAASHQAAGLCAARDRHALPVGQADCRAAAPQEKRAIFERPMPGCGVRRIQSDAQHRGIEWPDSGSLTATTSRRLWPTAEDRPSDAPRPEARVRPRGAVRTAGLIALLAMTPVLVMAETPPVPAPDSRTVRVSLADLDLSTPEGARAARDRLHNTARRLCSQFQLVHTQDLSHQPNFVACVDQALADALRQVDALPPTKRPALASVPGSHDLSR